MGVRVWCSGNAVILFVVLYDDWRARGEVNVGRHSASLCVTVFSDMFKTDAATSWDYRTCNFPHDRPVCSLSLPMCVCVCLK